MATFDMAVRERLLLGVERLAYMAIGDNDGIAVDEVVSKWTNEPDFEAVRLIHSLKAKGMLVEGEIDGRPALYCPRMRARYTADVALREGQAS